MKKRIFAGLLLVIGFLIPNATLGQRGPIKIGVSLPITGIVASFGEENLRGMRLYLDEIGNQFAGRKVELVVEDEVNPAVGLPKVRKLVESDKVHVLVGLVFSGLAYAVRDYVLSQKVPLIITTAGARDITLEGKNPYVFRTANDNTQENLAFGYYAYKKLGYKRAIVVAQDDDAGREQAGAFSKMFVLAGGQVAQEIYPARGATDLAPFIAQLKLDQADVVYAWFSGTGAPQFIKTYTEYGHRKPIISQGAMTANPLLPLMGDSALGIVTAKHYSDSIDTPENQRFVRAFQQKYNVTPDAWAEQAYVGMKAVGEAIKAIGGDVENVPRFLEALRRTRFQGPAGLVQFDANQQRVFDVYIRRVEKRDGKLVNAIIDKIPMVSQSWTP